MDIILAIIQNWFDIPVLHLLDAFGGGVYWIMNVLVCKVKSVVFLCSPWCYAFSSAIGYLISEVFNFYFPSNAESQFPERQEIDSAGLRVIICFDGTANDPRHRTNVRKFYESVELHLVNSGNAYLPEGDGWYQHPIYIPGVAFFEDMLPLRWWDSIRGHSVPHRIWIAYEALVTALQHEKRHIHDRLEICVVGFSRGAFSAILFCEALRRIGITTSTITEENFRKRFQEQHAPDEPSEFISSTPIFLGLWDTVAQTPLPDHWTYNADNVLAERIVHAMAWHEERSHFPLHRIAGPNCTSTWFRGSHSTIGGYTFPPPSEEDYANPPDHEELSNITLAWMQEKAAECGVQFQNQICLPRNRLNYYSKLIFFESTNSFVWPLKPKDWKVCRWIKQKFRWPGGIIRSKNMNDQAHVTLRLRNHDARQYTICRAGVEPEPNEEDFIADSDDSELVAMHGNYKNLNY